MTPLLEVRGLDAGYGQVQILFGLDLTIDRGEIVALLGTNGAGKSTLFKAVTGLLPPTRGVVFFDGDDITGLPTNEVAERGVVMMPGGRSVFPTLTVRDNLRLACWLKRKDPAAVRDAEERVLALFPRLAARTAAASRRLSQHARRRLSRTVSVGNTLRPPGIITTPRSAISLVGRPVMSSPSKSTAPRDGASSPVTALNSVDLPAPFVPRSATISPWSIVRSRPNRICTGP
jgi:ABC-type transport system involved in cytochrome c biogenesis ATPase subunit